MCRLPKGYGIQVSETNPMTSFGVLPEDYMVNHLCCDLFAEEPHQTINLCDTIRVRTPKPIHNTYGERKAI